jgi:hypothetical protein
VAGSWRPRAAAFYAKILPLALVVVVVIVIIGTVHVFTVAAIAVI